MIHSVIIKVIENQYIKNNWKSNRRNIMKNIKSYIIGFLTATCLFLFMGFDAADSTKIYLGNIK